MQPRTIAKTVCAAVAIIAIILLAMVVISAICHQDSDQKDEIGRLPIPTPTSIPTITRVPESVPTVVITPTPTPHPPPIPTPTKVVPIIIPTARRKVSPAPTPVPTAINSGLRLDVYLDTLYWDDSQIILARALPGGCGKNVSPFIEYALIYVGDELVATIVPIISYQNPSRPRRIIEVPLIINLPDGMSSTEGVTMKVAISGSPNLADGIYPNPITVLTPPEEYAEKHSTYPVYVP
jgi:hypothetical protein